MSYDTIIKLNIGGTVFQTSKSTLTKNDGFFKTLLETGIAITKDEFGAIFIDRNPKNFELMLNFMRSGNVELPDSMKELKEIREDAQFYLLNRFVDLCDMKTKLSQQEIVKLNIGGTLFQTSKATLTKFDGFFKTMLQSGKPLEKDDSGAIFIDRPAKHFELILNFMRDGHVSFPNALNDVREIRKEAKFYKLKNLMNIDLSLRVIYPKLNFGDIVSRKERLRCNTTLRSTMIVIYYDIENWNNVFCNIDVEEYVAKLGKLKVSFEEIFEEKITEGNWGFAFKRGNEYHWRPLQQHSVSEFLQKLEENLMICYQKNKSLE